MRPVKALDLVRRGAVPLPDLDLHVRLDVGVERRRAVAQVQRTVVVAELDVETRRVGVVVLLQADREHAVAHVGRLRRVGRVGRGGAGAEDPVPVFDERAVAEVRHPDRDAAARDVTSDRTPGCRR